MSIPISSSRMPPAVRSAGNEMPSHDNSVSPIRAKASRMTVATSVARNAIRRREAMVWDGVNAA